MSVPNSRLLGRRVDHILVDQSLFAWTHRVLGILAGLTLVFSMIAARDLQLNRFTYFSQRAFSYRAAFIFGFAALPCVISYFENRNRVDDRVPRTTLFLVLVGLISFGVDGLVIYLELIARNLPPVFSLYAGQAILYVGLGALLLNNTKRYFPRL